MITQENDESVLKKQKSDQKWLIIFLGKVCNHFTGLSFCLVDFLKISRMSQLIILLSSTFQNWPKQLKPTLYSKFKRENNGGVQVN